MRELDRRRRRVLDRRQAVKGDPGAGRRDPRGGLGHDRRLPADRRGADRRNPARRLPPGRAPHPARRRPSGAVPRLASPLLRATNRTLPLLTADIDHRDHATIELAIRDLKDQALAHFPSGHMHANSAWTVIAALAHNLGRWTTIIGLPDPTRADRPRQTPSPAPAPRPAHSHQPPMDTPTPRPLAMADRLHHRARRYSCAPRAYLTAHGPHDKHQHTSPPPGARTPAQKPDARTASATAPTATPPRTPPPGPHQPQRAPSHRVTPPNPAKPSHPPANR